MMTFRCDDSREPRRPNAGSIARRQFFAASGIAICGVSRTLLAEGHPVKIDRVELFPVAYPAVGHFKFLSSPRGRSQRPAVIVKITADTGVVGWGQSVPLPAWSYETLETSHIVLRDYLAPVLVGRDPLDIDGAHRALDRALAGSFSTGMPIARAGLDIALHDLAGRLTGKSLAQMLGQSALPELTLSWTVNPPSLDAAEALVEDGLRRGYRHFNIKVAPDGDADVALAKVVRGRIGDGFLWADANGGYEVDAALAAAPKLADAGVNVLEAPVKPNRLRGYRALKKLGAIPIYMDEGVVSPIELEEFIELEMLDGVAMKPSRCGGIASASKQIELLVAKGLRWLGSGLTDPDISLAASLALYGAYRLDKPAALNGLQFLAFSVLKRPVEVIDGRCKVPAGPGLGIEVDEEKLRELVARSPRFG